MRATGEFPWVPKMPESNGNALKVWFKDEKKTVYWHYHLSVYGKFQEQKVKQLQEMSGLLDSPPSSEGYRSDLAPLTLENKGKLNVDL
jgi:hypothetical protein